MTAIKLAVSPWPEKFHVIAGLARGDILVVREDDGYDLPQHTSSHVDTMNLQGTDSAEVPAPFTPPSH